MQTSAILTASAEGGYTALNPETGTVSEGDSIEEALSNLREAVELYLEEFPDTALKAPIITTISIPEHA